MDLKTNPEREEYVIETVLKPLGIGLSGITRHRELNKPVEKDAAYQKLRERNLCIWRLPEEQDEELTRDRLVHLFKNRLGVTDIEPSDIENVYWRGGKRRNLIVCFTSKNMRDRVYNRRRRVLINPDTKNEVFINDDITPLRSKLLSEARKLVKAKKIHAAWSEHGYVMVKRTEGDRPRTVYNPKQLAEACKK